MIGQLTFPDHPGRVYTLHDNGIWEAPDEPTTNWLNAMFRPYNHGPACMPFGIMAFRAAAAAEPDAKAENVRQYDPLPDDELAYLNKFRDLDAERKRIVSTILDVQKLCESLKDWQKAAAAIAVTSDDSWSEERLRKIAGLRAMLATYHGLAIESQKLWERLPEQQRVGLTPPSA